MSPQVLTGASRPSKGEDRPAGGRTKQSDGTRQTELQRRGVRCRVYLRWRLTTRRPSCLPDPCGSAMRKKIAADRLDTTSISSLKAALAGVTVNDALTTGPRLVERIDAAAKLAADATAAAEAVETLKRLLQAQLAASRPPLDIAPVVALSVGPGPGAAAAVEPLPSAPLAPSSGAPTSTVSSRASSSRARSAPCSTST